ncbi:MAG: hypothetical protein ABI397_02945 [Candidatus Saccharimonas sp.]
MSENENLIKDFPGDGPTNIHLHHGEPAYWTRKATVISTILIALVIIGGVIAIIMTKNL